MKFLKKNPNVLMNIIPDNLNTLDIQNQLEMDESGNKNNRRKDNKAKLLSSIERGEISNSGKFNNNRKNRGLNNNNSILSDNRMINYSTLKNDILPTADSINRSHIDASRLEHKFDQLPNVSNRDGLNSRSFSNALPQFSNKIKDNKKSKQNDNRDYILNIDTENKEQSHSSDKFDEVSDQPQSLSEFESSKIDSNQQCSVSSIMERHTIIFDDNKVESNPSGLSKFSANNTGTKEPQANWAIGLRQSQDLRKSATVDKNTQTRVYEGGEHDTEDNKDDQIYLNTNSVEMNPHLADLIHADSYSVSKHTIDMNSADEREDRLRPEMADQAVQINPQSKITKNEKIQFSSPKDK